MTWIEIIGIQKLLTVKSEFEKWRKFIGESSKFPQFQKNGISSCALASINCDNFIVLKLFQFLKYIKNLPWFCSNDKYCYKYCFQPLCPKFMFLDE